LTGADFVVFTDQKSLEAYNFKDNHGIWSRFLYDMAMVSPKIKFINRELNTVADG
jgi:hypothetical protein